MFGKLVLSHPECREAQGFMGNVFLVNGNYNKALIHINKALNDQKKYQSFVDEKSNYGNLGVIYMHQNKTKQALDIFLKLKSQQNYNPEVNFNIGICYKRLKDFQAAKTHLEKYLKLRPNNIDALFNLGAIGVELNDKEMSRHYFTEYLKINPTSEFKSTIEELLKS